MEGSEESFSDFYSLSRDGLSEVLAAKFEEPPFRAIQLFDWVYRKGVTETSQMSNISKGLRDRFTDEFTFPKPKLAKRLISTDGTRKYLFELGEGDLVESVMIKQPTRMTLCLSTQVGCAMGCTFCRTGTMGLKRNLTASEIIRQVMGVIDDAKNFDDHFTNIVFMGMGEPLHNWKNLFSAISILKDVHGLGVAPRKITVSTSGLVPGIKRFMESGLNVKLAVSLNATTDEVRSQIMPVNKNFNLAELLDCLREYFQDPKKPVTLEYVLLGGVNDSVADLKRLPKLIRGLSAKINLIPYNLNAGLGFSAPEPGLAERWQRELNAAGIVATIRWSRGHDIAAACGQLVTESKSSKLAIL